MAGERLEVEHLRPLARPAASSRLLADAGRAADDAPVESRRQALELGDDGAPKLAVTAVEHVDVKPIWSSTVASAPQRLPPRQQ